MVSSGGQPVHCNVDAQYLVALSHRLPDGAGKIINVMTMQPRTENNHCAARPARYVFLEMNSAVSSATASDPATS